MYFNLISSLIEISATIHGSKVNGAEPFVGWGSCSDLHESLEKEVASLVVPLPPLPKTGEITAACMSNTGLEIAEPTYCSPSGFH